MPSTHHSSSSLVRLSNHGRTRLNNSNHGRTRLNNSNHSRSTIHRRRGRSSHHRSSTAPIRIRSQSFQAIVVIFIVWIMYINFRAVKFNATVAKQPLSTKSIVDKTWKVDHHIAANNADRETKESSSRNITQTVAGEGSRSETKQVEQQEKRTTDTDDVEHSAKLDEKNILFDMEFDWDDVNLTRKGNCGWHKCFWPSVSNKKVGYLVAEQKQDRQMLKAVSVAKDLEKRYNSKHFHLGLLFVNVTTELRDRLNSLVDQPARRIRGQEMTEIYKSNRLVIEKVRIAPDPGFFFATNKANLGLTVQQLESFRKGIPDKEAFRVQLEAERRKLKRVLSDNPTLALDFQAVIDTTGNFYHIDLDGHISHAKRDNMTEYHAAATLDLLDQVTKNLTTSTFWIMHHCNSTKRI